MPTRKKSGFTLIELLVVIAIIAILAAILFPVFARAREAARKATCQSNMKECAIALQQYWNDYDATIPSSILGAAAAAGATPLAPGAVPTAAQQVDFITKQGVLPPGSARPYTWPMALYEHMGKNKDIMFCPSDSVDHNISTDAVSYWWKTSADKAWYDTNIKAQKEGDFAYNADQIIFYERGGFHDGNQGGLKNGVQVNVAYMDSHVKNVTLKDSATTATTDCAAVIEPMYWNYDNGDDNTQLPTTMAPIASKIDPRRYSDKL